jgi:hypothetical protein
MLTSQIISLFPLIDVVLRFGVVGSGVVIKDPLAHLQISKSDSSCQSSEIIDYGVVRSEEIKNLVCLGIR